MSQRKQNDRKEKINNNSLQRSHLRTFPCCNGQDFKSVKTCSNTFYMHMCVYIYCIVVGRGTQRVGNWGGVGRHAWESCCSTNWEPNGS